jgi:predicted HD superfamily hydrolase involved in NAD metabolism
MSNKIEQYTGLINKRLSKPRYTHSLRTAEMCRELACVHGFDPEKAYMTGILHDICKEECEKEVKRLVHLKFFEKLGFGLDPLEKEERKLWHAPAGAAFIKETLEIKDMEIIAAVRYHTVGRAGMSKLEKIVYLGDLVGHDREYHEVEKYRDFALRDLNTGMYEALKWAINDCLTHKKRISQNTLDAYNYYLNKIYK